MAKFFILAFVVPMCTAQDDPGVFQFQVSEIRVSESASPVVIVIENTGNTTQSAVLSVSTTDETAIAGQDFIGISNRQITFTSGEGQISVPIMIIDDSEVEGEESFVVHLRLLGPSRPSATLGPKSDVTITIVDDDQQPTEPPVSADGGNITLDSEARLHRSISTDFRLPRLIVNDSSLHLEDKACGAGYKDDAMVKFTFGLEACKTEQEDDGKKIYYRNKVYFTANVEAAIAP
ncbi:hypothetical protein OS493_031080 [Desmophyllum pertusum]|uniref:Calx-beta domain-containing protein n=1 Tax=Desmophyllum pertusum TaxID=174260 RepID=A0A9W9YJM0_9CNID|nr:hypothetical protein OS493_031080 [Desmophyllum pertusum]